MLSNNTYRDARAYLPHPMGRKRDPVPTAAAPRAGGIKYLPFVSVCTVTFNRRPFWPAALELFRAQTYPKNRMEWIIVDDGTDKVRDLVEAAGIPQIKYVALEAKMALGAKRNLSHAHCKGSIIVYMDDDDYYPPERVAHAVERLTAHPEAMCAGASELYIYFKHIAQMWQCGPYNPGHATAGTFAFRRELLLTSRYDEGAALAEEKNFLHNYTVPFVQLDPRKTILVFSHIHNTFDKRRMLDSPHPQYFKLSPRSVDDFIVGRGAPAMRAFFMSDVDAQLALYEPGHVRHKPDAVAQMRAIELEHARLSRELEAENERLEREAAAARDDKYSPIVVQTAGQPRRVLTSDEVVALIQSQQAQIQELARRLAATGGDSALAS